MKILAGVMVAAGVLWAHDISSQVTWAREISRFNARHCESCHRAGGSSFPLETFEQAQARAKDIAKAVLDRSMPPFGTVKGFGELREDQSLTQEQIEMVILWVQGGAPQGNPALAPKAPEKIAAPPAEPRTGEEWIAGSGKTLAAERSFIAIRPKTLDADSVRVIAERPDGSVEPLIWFYRYDPKFPRTYYFRKPVKLPAGTRIVASTPGARVALVAPAR